MVLQELGLPGTQTLTLTKAVLIAPAGPASTVRGSTLGGPGVGIICVGGGGGALTTLLLPYPPPPQAARNPSWIKARATNFRTGFPQSRWRVSIDVAD